MEAIEGALNYPQMTYHYKNIYKRHDFYCTGIGTDIQLLILSLGTFIFRISAILVSRGASL